MFKSFNLQNISSKNVTTTTIDQIEENILIFRLKATREMIKFQNQQNNDFLLSNQDYIKLTGEQMMAVRQKALASLSQQQKLKF